MAGIEYIPTNLPRYVTITPRTAVANSAVAPNHILMLSEDGRSVTAKQSDGSFKVIAIDPSDTTATADDVASGKLFYNASGVLTTGTASGGSMDFYKCASVDTTNSTWTGYKAVLSSGVYSFESTATTGLFYTVITPQVGGVYADGALIKATLFDGMPNDGLVFYAPLATSSQTAETGQQLTENGTVVFGSERGVPCAYFNGTYISASDSDLPMGGNVRTISMWLLANHKGPNFFGYGTVANNKLFMLYPNESPYDLTANFHGSAVRIGDGYHNLIDNDWHHVLIIATASGTSAAYIDGIPVPIASGSFSSMNTASGRLELGNASFWGDPANPCYLAAVRIYNRALTSAEIQLLASEFTPTQGA